MSELSKSQVRKAGKVLRKVEEGDRSIDDVEIRHAHEVLTQYRGAHSPALVKATMGLRSRVRTAGYEVVVSQRLKERSTILRKLVRYPAMQLTTMQDIAGCRAILPDVAAVRLVEARWRTGSWAGRVQRVDDYITEPKSSGYRGLHLMVEYDERVVEVQLRSQAQHDWAYTVEVVGGRLGFGLKMGEGPAELINLLAVLAEINERQSREAEVPATLMAQWGEAQVAAAPYLRGTSGG